MLFTPEDHVGDVIGDLNRRRGVIKAQETGSLGSRVKADAPLGEMFGYIGDLRTMTSGAVSFRWNFPIMLHARVILQKKLSKKQKKKELS